MNQPEETVDIYSEEDRVVVSLNSMQREGDRLCMGGKLMGAFDAKMYVQPEMIGRLIKLILTWSFIGYLFSLPFILARRKKSGETKRLIKS